MTQDEINDLWACLFLSKPELHELLDFAKSADQPPYLFPMVAFVAHTGARRSKLIRMRIDDVDLEVGAAVIRKRLGRTPVGSRYHLEVGGDDFSIDLLFYHLKLPCYIVFDLKARAFTPEAVRKMNFYCSMVDDQLRHQSDHRTLGIILCKSKNKGVAEYSLRNIETPLAISTYVTQLVESLPDELAKELETAPGGPPERKAKTK